MAGGITAAVIGGTALFDWQDAASVITGSNTYMTPWQLTNSQWNLLAPGTNYISVNLK